MKLGIIVGSVRQGRVSDKIAQWVRDAAKKQPGVEVELIDLLDYKLPHFDEPISPQYNQNRVTTGETKRWLDTLAAQDAYVIVTPEYNRSIPGVLKNALDYVGYELSGKPVAITSHGASNGGQAVAHMRSIIPGLLAVTVPTFVGLPFGVAASFDADGKTEADESGQFAAQLDKVLGELTKYGTALATAQK